MASETVIAREVRTFAVIGGSLWGNRGAEAMVVTTIGRVREHFSESSFLLLSYYPTADRQLAFGTGLEVDDATPVSLLAVYLPFALVCWFLRQLGLHLPDAIMPGRVRRLRACSAIFDVSGISFHDGRLHIVPYNVLCIWPSLLLGVPVIRLSQAVGPFRRVLNRLPSRWLLKACHHSFVRGRMSAAHMSTLDLNPERWSLAADVAFDFRSGDSITGEGEGAVEDLKKQITRLKSQGISIVALTPSSVVLSKMRKVGIDYLKVLMQVILHLQRRRYHVLILPNATRAGFDEPRNNDLFVIQRLKELVESNPAQIDASRLFWVLFDLNTDSIRELIRPCELLITSRFHSMVAGLALTVPTLVIGWSHKYLEVLELFDCEANAIDFSLVQERLLVTIDRMLDERRAIKAKVALALPAVTASSHRQFQSAFQVLT